MGVARRDSRGPSPCRPQLYPIILGFATGNPAQNFTFLTVKGAGHMVPKDRPRHALDMLARFLDGGEYAKVEKAAEAPLCAP